MNYGDKHTEDSLSSRLGRLYGIERGLLQKMQQLTKKLRRRR